MNNYQTSDGFETSDVFPSWPIS